MREAILSRLNSIASRENIRILYSVESGSRAWGFESIDSDYDVRFIYVRPLEYYLSIEEGNDFIEENDRLFDLSGWDLKKTLKLFGKSNPQLFEWLSSPIVYIEDTNFTDNLRKLKTEFFFPKKSIYHYLHMAKGNYKEYLKGDIVRLKKYFYVLRPILACKWIESKNETPPVEFEKTIVLLESEPHILKEVKLLLEKKKN